MILLKSTKEMVNQGKEGDVMSHIYCIGEYMGITKTQLKFREVFYYIQTHKEPNPSKEEGQPAMIDVETHVKLKSPKDRDDIKFLPLRMKDFGDKPTADEIKYNQSTIQFLFNNFGVDILTTDNFADKIEENFYTIFPAVQTANKSWKVEGWTVEHLSY